MISGKPSLLTSPAQASDFPKAVPVISPVVIQASVVSGPDDDPKKRYAAQFGHHLTRQLWCGPGCHRGANHARLWRDVGG